MSPAHSHALQETRASQETDKRSRSLAPQTWLTPRSISHSNASGLQLDLTHRDNQAPSTGKAERSKRYRFGWFKSKVPVSSTLPSRTLSNASTTSKPLSHTASNSSSSAVSDVPSQERQISRDRLSQPPSNVSSQRGSDGLSRPAPTYSKPELLLEGGSPDQAAAIIDRGDAAITEPAVEHTAKDLCKSAFSKACAGLDAKQQAFLADGSHMGQFFHDLNAELDSRTGLPAIAKGAKICKKILQGADIALDIASIAAVVYAPASPAVSVAKGVVKICITICGLSEESREQIGSLLEMLPILDRCDEAASSKQSAQVEEALIHIYEQILDFFFSMKSAFDSKSTPWHIFAEKYVKGDKFGTIIKEVEEASERLLKLVQVETYLTIREIRDTRNEDEVKKLFIQQSHIESDIENEVGRYSPDACKWIDFEQRYISWEKSLDRSTFVILDGDMGSGKSIAVSYVAAHFRAQAPITKSSRSAVCSYFVRDDGITNQAVNILRSLCRQIADSQDSWMCVAEWHKIAKPQTQSCPSYSEAKLSELLLALVSNLTRTCWMMFDGINACDRRNLTIILDNLERVHKQGPHARIFISAWDSSLRSRFAGITSIHMLQSQERDKLIAKWHVEAMPLDDQTKTDLVEKLARLAQGSAIWIYLVVQHIASNDVRSNHNVLRYVDDLPAQNELTSLYVKMFNTAVQDNDRNRAWLSACLELLAISKRPLTIAELALAVNLSISDHRHTLKALQDRADPEEGQIARQIRPFVSYLGDSDKPETRVKLVHRSLKALVLQQSPYTWPQSTADNRLKDTSRRSGKSREIKLNLTMLRICLRYLLLREFKTLAVQQSDLETADFCGLEGFGDLDFDTESEPVVTDDPPDSEATDSDFEDHGSQKPVIVTSGLGYGDSAGRISTGRIDAQFGAFYKYAACHWFAHYTSTICPEDDSDIQNLSAVFDSRSGQYANWTASARAFAQGYIDSSITVAYVQDPLTFCVYYGTLNALRMVADQAQMLKNPPLGQAAFDAAIEAAITIKNFRAVRLLVEHPLSSQNLKVWEWISYMSMIWSSLEAVEQTEWTGILDLMCTNYEQDLITEARWVLHEAARSGCLPLAQKIICLAMTLPTAYDSLWEPTRGENAWVSLGIGGYGNNRAMVKFLIQQKGAETLVLQCSYLDENILHEMARRPDLEITKFLVERYPELMHDARSGNTPIEMMLNVSPDTSETRQVILYLWQNMQPKLSDSQEAAIFKYAITYLWYEMCHVLIVQRHLDPCTAFGLLRQSGEMQLVEYLERNRKNRSGLTRKDVVNFVSSILALASAGSP